MKKLLLLALSMVLLLGCTPDLTENCHYQPKIIDESGTLSNKTKELFTNFDYPFGVYPVLYNLGEIENKINTGSVADGIYKSLAKDNQNFKDFKKVGFLIVISEDPMLIQVRMGKKYESYCNLTGITAGEEYLMLQNQLATDGINKSLVSFLEMISTRINERNSLPLHKKTRINSALEFVNSSLDFVGTPSENLYGKAFLKPMLVILSFIYRLVHNWGLALIVLFVAALALKYLYDKSMDNMLKDNQLLLFFVKTVMGIIFGLFISVSAAGAAFLLSKGRMEDIIAMSAMGVPFVENLAIDPSGFKAGNPIWLVILFTILWTIKISVNDMFFLSLIPDEKQKEHFNKLNPVQQNFYNGMAGGEVDLTHSDAPYTDYIVHHMTQNVAQTSFSLTIAALFLLPRVIILIAIAIALKSTYENGRALFLLSKRGFFLDKDAEEKKVRLWMMLGVIGVICLISLCVSPFMDPRPKREKVQYENLKTDLIEAVDIEGNYTFESETDGKVVYSSAMLKRTGENTYRLLITTESDPIIFNLTYDTDNMCLLSDELSVGNIHHDKTLDIIQIKFQFNPYTKWVLSK